MPINRSALLALLALALLLFGGCSSLRHSEPLQVIVAGVEPLQGQGLELRMLVKLRIQNPNDLPVDFNGVYVQMDVQGKSFASGVSDTAGSVPRFGESVVEVPVSISAFSIARHAIGIFTNEYQDKVEYELTGKLAGSTFNSVHFKSHGELTLPTGAPEGSQ